LAALNFLLPLLLLVGSAHAQEPVPQWGTWHVVGPFDHDGGGLNMEEEHAPEKDVRRMLVGKQWKGLKKYYRGKGKEKVFWTALKDTRDVLDIGEIDFNKVVTPTPGMKDWNANVVAYLYRPIYVERETKIRIHCGSDDGLRLWLNGLPFLTHNQNRGLSATAHEKLLVLSPGYNHLVAKVGNAGGEWKFRMLPYQRVPQERINQAIDRGVKYLLARQYIDGSWLGDTPKYRNGQTALSVYTLLKSGLSPKNVAIQSGLAYLGESPTSMTYSAGCHLMALAALPGQETLAWMEEILGDLMSWQNRDGTWAYPSGAPDLSTTQFAALGLRAGAQKGLKIPDRVWVDLAEGVLNYQVRKEKVDPPLSPGEKYSKQREIAGFTYRSTRPMGAARGSMSTAGVGTLAICIEALGTRMPPNLGPRIERRMDLGLQWVNHHWSVSRNPGYSHWLHYYLYGIERIGSILDIEKIGNHDWYWQGAKFLVNSQKPKGWWPDPYGRNDSATCFSLLFLERASRFAFTDSHGKNKRSVAFSDPKAGPIQMRAIAGLPSSFWISGMDDQLRRSEKILVVQYFGRQKDQEWNLLTESFLPEDSTSDERYSGRYSFEKPGAWDIKAIAQCESGKEVASGNATLNISDVPPKGMPSYPKDAGRNLILKMKASTEVSSGGNRWHLIDNRIGTNWWCAKKDDKPEFTISFQRPAPIEKILFTPAENNAWSHQTPKPMPKIVRIFIDRDDPIDLDMELSFRKKTELVLPEPRSIRKLRVQILDIVNGEIGAAAIGFAEVEFQGPKKRRSRRR